MADGCSTSVESWRERESDGERGREAERGKEGGKATPANRERERKIGLGIYHDIIEVVVIKGAVHVKFIDLESLQFHSEMLLQQKLKLC